MDIREHNEIAWNHEVEIGNRWTIPVSSEEVEKAKAGIFSVVLTPTTPVPGQWFGNLKGKQLLCLASGGGQQAPLFAAAGAKVTLLDNSLAQLNSDRMVAQRDNLEITTVQGDMRDLSCFDDASFDLIFHPVSNCFVDSVLPVWKECYRVLKAGGRLLAGFTNPIVYLFDSETADQETLIAKNTIPYDDRKALSPEALQRRIDEHDTIEFGHTLEDQIGGQLKAGFVLLDLYEDIAPGDLLSSYIPTFMATLAEKR